MKKSRITFVVDRERVETIVGLLIKEVTDFKVEEVDNVRGSRANDSTRWANGPALSVIEYMKKFPDKEFFYKDLGSLMEKHDMKKTSVTPILSLLFKHGRIKRTRRGYYKIV